MKAENSNRNSERLIAMREKMLDHNDVVIGEGSCRIWYCSENVLVMQ